MRDDNLASILKTHEDLASIVKNISARTNPIGHMNDSLMQAAARAQSLVNSWVNWEAITKQSLRLNDQVAMFREIQRNFMPPVSHLQEAVANANRLVRSYQLDMLLKQRPLDFAKFAALDYKPPSSAISQAISSALAESAALQSTSVTRMIERIVSETNFRRQFAEQLTDLYRQPTPEPEATVDEAQVLAAVDSAIEKSGLIKPAADEQVAIRSFFEWLKGAHPDIKNLVISVLGSLIATLIVLLVSHQAGNTYTTNVNVGKVSIIQELKLIRNTIINLQLPKDTGKNLRIVATKELRVYGSNRLDSERIATIGYPQVVLVKSKKRNWCEVVWTDQLTGETKEGWTLTRYLKRL